MGEQIQSIEECRTGHEGLKRSHILQLNCEEATPTLNHPSECLLQRIDHLDDILSTMEDKPPTEHSTSPSVSPRTTSRRHSSAPTTPSGLEKRRRPTEFVLEEVQEKGTLVERISDLEKRVMTLQRMLPSKSSESPSGFPHRRVMSHQETYDQQFLQEPMDVEKHEVMTLSQSDPSKRKSQYPEPFVDSISHDPDEAKLESPHVKHHEDMVSSGKASDAEEHDSRVPSQVSKKKRLKIRKWLSKRLHIHLPGTPQDKHRCLPGHGCGPQIHPNSCWNARKRDSRSTPYTQYGHMPIDDE